MYLVFYILGIICCAVGGWYIGTGIYGDVENYIIAAILFGVGALCLVGGILYASLPRKHVKKKRTEYVATYNCSEERVRFAINSFMLEKEFKPLQYLDEEVYKKGNGWWMARRFIKYTINDDNTVTIEGWVSMGVGNVASTEDNLNGFLGFAPKQQLKKDIEELKTRIGNLAD